MDTKKRTGLGRLGPYVWAILIVLPCVAGLRLMPAIDNGAAAPILLLAVLVSARTWGTGPALVTSVTATMAYDYFFLGSIGFELKDPADWAAFITFTFSALIVGELAGRAERRNSKRRRGGARSSGSIRNCRRRSTARARPRRRGATSS